MEDSARRTTATTVVHVRSIDPSNRHHLVSTGMFESCVVETTVLGCMAFSMHSALYECIYGDESEKTRNIKELHSAYNSFLL